MRASSLFVVVRVGRMTFVVLASSMAGRLFTTFKTISVRTFAWPPLLMFRFLRSAGFRRGQIPFPQLSFKQFQRQTVGLQGQFRIVAGAFVAQKGVLPVELVPGEMHAG